VKNRRGGRSAPTTVNSSVRTREYLTTAEIERRGWRLLALQASQGAYLVTLHRMGDGLHSRRRRRQGDLRRIALRCSGVSMLKKIPQCLCTGQWSGSPRRFNALSCFNVRLDSPAPGAIYYAHVLRRVAFPDFCEPCLPPSREAARWGRVAA
jgi:hypothetical protein